MICCFSLAVCCYSPLFNLNVIWIICLSLFKPSLSIGGWDKPAPGGIEDWGKQLGREIQGGTLDPLLHEEKLIVDPREDTTSKYVPVATDNWICISSLSSSLWSSLFNFISEPQWNILPNLHQIYFDLHFYLSHYIYASVNLCTSIHFSVSLPHCFFFISQLISPHLLHLSYTFVTDDLIAKSLAFCLLSLVFMTIFTEF